MKMKLGMLVVCMTLVISTTISYADSEDVDIDVHTCEEIRIFNNKYGSEIRFLQLDKSVTNNIYKGELIITNLSELGYETIDLEVILAEMDLLLGEIQAVDVNSSEAVYLFVELKQDAINLSKEFRETLHGLVVAETIAALQEMTKNKVSEKAQGLQISIQNKIRLYNRQQLNEIFGLLGKADSQDPQKYQNGILSLTQVKQNLALGASELAEEEKFNFLVELQSGNIRLQIRSRVNIQNVTNNYSHRECNRLQNRLNNSENIGNETLRLQLQQRLRLRINQTDSGQSGNGDGNGQGSGDGGNGSGSGNGDGSGNNETGNGDGYHNGPGGGGP
jgi:hypothetical protein